MDTFSPSFFLTTKDTKVFTKDTKAIRVIAFVSFVKTFVSFVVKNGMVFN